MDLEDLPLGMSSWWWDDSLTYVLCEEEAGEPLFCWYCSQSLYFVGGWNYLCCFPR